MLQRNNRQQNVYEFSENGAHLDASYVEYVN